MVHFVTDINLRGNRLVNGKEPESDGDLVTKSYVDERVTLLKPIISVCAEEQGSLSNGSYEFSFGNGSAGVSHGIGGYCMPAPGKIIRGTLMIVRGNGILKEKAKVNIVINGVEQVDYSIEKKQGEGCSCIVFPQPLVLDQCDVTNFITRSDNPNAKNAYLTILIELDL